METGDALSDGVSEDRLSALQSVVLSLERENEEFKRQFSALWKKTDDNAKNLTRIEISAFGRISKLAGGIDKVESHIKEQLLNLRNDCDKKIGGIRIKLNLWIGFLSVIGTALLAVLGAILVEKLKG